MKATSDTESPLVSVVVPFYNVEDYAEACLASLAAQTFERCEIPCIDDGSTDDTPRVLARFADLDPRIQVHLIEHAGFSVARCLYLDVPFPPGMVFEDAHTTRKHYKCSSQSPSKVIKSRWPSWLEEACLSISQ